MEENKISVPGKYSGYSPVLYDGYKLISIYVPMRDGVKLAVDIIRPTSKDQLEEKPLPVIWMHTPYNRRHYPPTGNKNLTAQFYPGAALGLVKYGYVVSAVDMRGTFASFGTTYSGDHWDAYDMIEWFAVQPWCTGEVGMWGCSVPGMTQLAAANLMPPHLKAIFPLSAGSEPSAYGDRGVNLPPENPRMPPPSAEPGPFPPTDKAAVPVDEDSDGLQLRQASYDHRYNYLYKGKLAMMYKLSRDQIEQTGIAMYNAANWEDAVGVPMNSIRRFHNLSNPSKLLIGPGGHCQWYTDYSPKPEPVSFEIIPEELRFFDYWLKGVDNGIMSEPPIYYYTYNAPEDSVWRFSWQWPAPDVKSTTYYFGPGPSGSGYGVNDGTLTVTPPSDREGKDIYTTDYSIEGAMIAANTGGAGARGFIGHPEAATKGLAYVTPPFKEDMTISGTPVACLWISSTATDSDIMVDIEDIAPNGEIRSIIPIDRYPISKEIPSGQPLPDHINGIRASFRKTREPTFDNWDLPWRINSPENFEPLTPGEPTELVFDLRPLSYVVKAGHRIRTTLIMVCDEATPRLTPPPEVTFYRDAIRCSHIILPVAGTPIRAKVTIAKENADLEKTNGITLQVTFPGTLAGGYVNDINPDSVTCNGLPVLKGTLEKDTWQFKCNAENTPKNKTMIVKGRFGAKYNYGSLAFEGSLNL